MKRIPFETGDVEIRQISEPEDFAEVSTPKMVEKEKRLYAELEKKRKKSAPKK